MTVANSRKGGKKREPFVKRMYNLSATAYRWLQSEARRLDISASEVLRRIVDAERSRK